MDNKEHSLDKAGEQPGRETIHLALQRFEKKYAKRVITLGIILSVLYTAALCWLITYPYSNPAQKSPGLLWALGTCIAILNIAIAYGMVKMSRRDK